MKRFAVFGLLILVFLINLHFVSAISSDMKDIYSQKETILIEIKGNILEPIPTENVIFRRGHVGIPLEYDIKKLGESYYLWAIAPESENNYTLVIKNISTTAAGIPQKVDYEKNFSVSGNLSDYYIKPGFIFNQKTFEITATLNQDEDKEIIISYPIDKNITLKPGENKIAFSLDESETKLIKIAIGEYALPAYVIGKFVPGAFTGIISKKLSFNPEILEKNISDLKNLTTKYEIKLTNEFNESLKDIYLDYDSTFFTIEPKENFTLGAGESKYFNISLNKLAEGKIEEEIYARHGNESAVLSVKINFANITAVPLANYTNIPQEEQIKTSCTQIIEADLCGLDEKCPGTNITTTETKVNPKLVCCLKKCEKGKAEEGGGYFWIGILIIGIVILIGVIIYVRYKKSGKFWSGAFKRKVEEAEKKL